MPDTRTHRSAAPKDEQLFAPGFVPVLARATAHLAWLLSRGYAERSSLELVGNRFDLTARQREAVGRSACSEAARAGRSARRVDPGALRGSALELDGYNVLTTIEAALGGGVILHGQDGVFRDLASVHGTWRRVHETLPALELAGEFLAELGALRCTWFLDRPVSNSGRLARMIEALAIRRGWAWQVAIVPDADAALIASSGTVVSADRAILDACARWSNLVRSIVEKRVPGAWILDLSRSDAALE